jgi:hypothetical protein
LPPVWSNVNALMVGWLGCENENLHAIAISQGPPEVKRYVLPGEAIVVRDAAGVALISGVDHADGS